MALQALLSYDYALTLPDEIRCIWKRKFTSVTVLYFIMRYASIIAQTLEVVKFLSPAHPQESQQSTASVLIIQTSYGLFTSRVTGVISCPGRPLFSLRYFT